MGIVVTGVLSTLLKCVCVYIYMKLTHIDNLYNFSEYSILQFSFRAQGYKRKIQPNNIGEISVSDILNLAFTP